MFPNLELYILPGPLTFLNSMGTGGILIQTEHTTDRRIYTAPQSSVTRVSDNEPKSLIIERNWDYEMYPVSNKASDVEDNP